MSDLRLAFVGCVEAGYFIASRLLRAGFLPEAIVSISEATARHNQVSGYKCLFDLAPDVELYEPERYDLSANADLDFFAAKRFDVLIVLGWQRLIPATVIKSLSMCGLTIHGSADGLPKGRGRSPMNWAMIEGRDSFKLSVLTLAEGADAGVILGTMEFDILPADTIKTLYYKNALAASELLIRILPHLPELSGIIQDESQATYYPKRTPEDGRIIWTENALTIERMVRALTRPYPGARTCLGYEQLLIWHGQVFDGKLSVCSEPGRVGAVFADGAFLVGTGKSDFLVMDYDGPRPQEGDSLK